MIKLTNKVFNNLNFVETIQKIYRTELPAKDSYRLYKVLKILTERSKEYDEIKLKLLNETGNRSSEDEWQFDSKDNAERFKKEFDELLSIEFDLTEEKIKYPESLSLSPYEMELVEDIFDYSNLE